MPEGVEDDTEDEVVLPGSLGAVRRKSRSRRISGMRRGGEAVAVAAAVHGGGSQTCSGLSEREREQRRGKRELRGEG